MKKKEEKEKKNFLDKYNERETKGNVQNTILKGAVDTLAGSVVGTGLGAALGNKALLGGIGMILLGHYLGDESGLMRVTGASTMAFGIAKANEYQNNPEITTPSKRLSGLKDDWLTAFHIKWKKEQHNNSSQPEGERPEPDSPKDTSEELSDSELENEKSTAEFNKEQSDKESSFFGGEDNFDLSLI